MRKRTKIYSMILLVLLVGIIVYIYNTDYTENLNNYQEESSEKDDVKIITLALPVTSSIDIYEELINKFNIENQDDIVVEIVKIPYEKYNTTLNMLMTSGDGPDLFLIDYQWVISYIYREWLLDLSPYIDDNFFDRFNEQAINYIRYLDDGNGFYTMPSGVTTLRLIYNKQLFEETGLDPQNPPKKIIDLYDYAREIKDSNYNKFGFAIAGGNNWREYAEIIDIANSYSGIYYFDYEKGKYDLSGYKVFFDNIIKMETNDTVFSGIFLNYYNALSQFVEGNIGILYITNRDLEILFDNELLSFDWGITMPVKMGENDSSGYLKIIPSGLYGVNSKSSNAEEAFKVWDYLYSYQLNQFLFTKGIKIPTLEGIWDTQVENNYRDIKKFIPGDDEAIFPDPPLLEEQWMKIEAYKNIFNGSSIEDELDEKSKMLNGRLGLGQPYVTDQILQPYREFGFSVTNDKE